MRGGEFGVEGWIFEGTFVGMKEEMQRAGGLRTWSKVVMMLCCTSIRTDVV